MERMQPQLGYVTSTRFMREMMVPPKLPFTPAGLVHLVMARAAVDLLPPTVQDLYGFRWPSLNHILVRLGSALIMKTAAGKVPQDKFITELRAPTDCMHSAARRSSYGTRGNPCKPHSCLATPQTLVRLAAAARRASR